jgi:hypothetical protein
MEASHTPSGRTPRKNFLTGVPIHLCIHSYPRACTGMHGHVCVLRMKLRLSAVSSGVCCTIVAVSFADNQRSNAVRRTVHGRQGNRISICRVTFDEHRSIVREPRTKPQRTGIEAPTNRGRSQPHCRNHVDARACAWIGVDAKRYPYGPSKKLLSEARVGRPQLQRRRSGLYDKRLSANHATRGLVGNIAGD